jgi:hypothetical protein
VKKPAKKAAKKAAKTVTAKRTPARGGGSADTWA